MSLSDVQTLSESWQQEWFYIGILSDITSPGMTKESSTGGGGGGVAGGKQTEANRDTRRKACLQNGGSKCTAGQKV